MGKAKGRRGKPRKAKWLSPRISPRPSSRPSPRPSPRQSPWQSSQHVTSSSSTPTSASPRQLTRRKLSGTPKRLGTASTSQGKDAATSSHISQFDEILVRARAKSTPMTDETLHTTSALGHVDPNSSSGSSSSAFSPEGVLRSGQQRYGLRDMSNRKSLDLSRSKPHPYSTPGTSCQKRVSLNPKTPARTPYRTPKVKSLFRDDIEDIDEIEKKKTHNPKQIEKWKTELKELMKGMWKINYVSTLNNFNFDNKKILKQYENYLRKRVKDVYASYKLRVKIDCSSCLRKQPRDVDAVRIFIATSVPHDNPEEDYMKTIYTAWLFRSTKIQSRSMNGAHWFPVMFYNGLVSLHNMVAGWLSSSFGAYVSATNLRPLDLTWMAGVFSGKRCSVPSHNRLRIPTDRLVNLKYVIKPPQRKKEFSSKILNTGRHLLSLRIPLGDIQELWSSIIDTSEQDVKLEDLNAYYESLEGFVENIVHLPKALLLLYELNTPCFLLRANGIIKLPCRNSLPNIIWQLMDLHIQGTQLFQDEGGQLEDSAFLRDDESFNSSSSSPDSSHVDSPS